MADPENPESSKTVGAMDVSILWPNPRNRYGRKFAMAKGSVFRTCAMDVLTYRYGRRTLRGGRKTSMARYSYEFGQMFHKGMMIQSGKELKLVGGLEVFNGYENSEHLGKVKAAKVTST